MNLTEIIFLIAFLAMIIISFVKIINVFKVGEWYSLGVGFILFIAYLISFLMIFISTSSMLTELIYFQLFRLCSWLFIPNFLFLFFEIIFNLKSNSLEAIKPYDPLKPKIYNPIKK